MKKITITLFFAALSFFNTNTLNAQAFEEGSMVLNLGAGVGTKYATGFGISGSFELGIWPTGDFGIIGLGVISGFTISDDVITMGSVDYTEFAIGPRGTYHFTIIPVENLDVYAAADLLFVSQTTKYKDGVTPNDSDFKFRPGAVAGARYYFSDFFGVFGELGYSVTFLTGGISLKF